MRLPVCGWLLCFGPPIGGQFMPPCILFSLFLHCSIQCPKRWDSVSPCAPPPACHLSELLLPVLSTLDLLLCCPFKFGPLKAKATPIALLFDGVCVNIPNKGTDRGTTKTVSASLAWTHVKMLHQELGPWQIFPWK